MSLTADSMTPADIRACTCGSDNNGGGWGLGGDGLIALIVLFLFGSMFGWGGMGMGGFGGFGGMGGGFWPWLLYGNNGFGGRCGEPCATASDVRAAVDQQTLISKLDNQTYGLADSTYALSNAITGGFASAELSRCNQQAALMAQLCAMQADSAKCCFETQRLIERGFADTNYNMATQACETRNTIQNTTRDVIDNQNANARAILDALTAQRIADKDDRIAAQQQKIFALELAASQANQNAVLQAAMDANTATILRRTGAECPTAAYLVQPPTPVNFPVNGCGQVQFNGNCNHCNPCGGSF